MPDLHHSIEEIAEAVAAYRLRFAVGWLCWVCLARFDPLAPSGPPRDGARCSSCREVQLTDVMPYADHHNNHARRTH